MNGYLLMAESYRKLLTDEKISKEVAEKNIRIFDFFASCDNDDFCCMVDTGAFNDIIKAFLEHAIKMANLDDISERKMFSQIRYLFDDISAKDVLNKYYNS